MSILTSFAGVVIDSDGTLSVVRKGGLLILCTNNSGIYVGVDTGKVLTLPGVSQLILRVTSYNGGLARRTNGQSSPAPLCVVRYKRVVEVDQQPAEGPHRNPVSSGGVELDEELWLASESGDPLESLGVVTSIASTASS